MSEIEKMYRNAHVYPKVYRDITKETFENKAFNMADMCNEAFTAEKQIELIKFLAKNLWCGHLDWLVSCCKSFEESLATLINTIWQDLTEEEKQQVKGILE